MWLRGAGVGKEAGRRGLALRARVLSRTILQAKLTIIRGPAGPVSKTSSHLGFLTADVSSSEGWKGYRTLICISSCPTSQWAVCNPALVTLHMALRDGGSQ